MSRVVVLVLAWNGVDYLRPCLQALAHQQGIDSYGVLVVDNGSTDGSAELVEHEFPDVALLRLPSNLGFAAGNNAGIRALLAGQAPLPLADTPPRYCGAAQSRYRSGPRLAGAACGCFRSAGTGGHCWLQNLLP
ncbi:MAG: glycosyltransferase [Chloroflexaceae bacterium]|nr:glycosyltransferase [Chloroflexaceae bacterium]